MSYDHVNKYFTKLWKLQIVVIAGAMQYAYKLFILMGGVTECRMGIAPAQLTNLVVT